MNVAIWGPELERMQRHLVFVDAAFDELVVFFRRRSAIAVEIGTGAPAVDAFELADDTVVVHTRFVGSMRETLRRRLGDDLAPWVTEHDDARGVPCFRAAHLEMVLGARSYEEAVHLLGDDVSFLAIPDCLAMTRGDDD